MTSEVIKVSVIADQIPPVIKVDSISYKVKD